MARYLSASSSWRRISSRRADESTEISSLGIEIVTEIVTETVTETFSEIVTDIVNEIVTETVSKIVTEIVTETVSEIVTEIVNEIVTEISSLGIVTTRVRLLVIYRMSKDSLFDFWEKLANRYCFVLFSEQFCASVFNFQLQRGKVSLKKRLKGCNEYRCSITK